ncbi:TerD family protein [Streptomyces sp. NPDC005438]|uniref:TerD family protein n=1 Tax=Streptomyces sp. NPDC005438 TaxID=3156880 RepID=UPI0033B5C476
MSSLNKGVGKVEVALMWDPSPAGEPDTDLDLIAATYERDDLHGDPSYLVHFDARSPDGTITLNRDSTTGQGFGPDELLTLEFERIPESLGRVVVGVAIQQRPTPRTFAEVAGGAIRIREGVLDLFEGDFTDVARYTAATVAEFVRDDSGAWQYQPLVQGFDADPATFVTVMGRPRG